MLLFSWWLALHEDARMREELLESSRLAAQLLVRDDAAGLGRGVAHQLPAQAGGLSRQLDALRSAQPGCLQAALLGQWATGAPAVLAQSGALGAAVPRAAGPEAEALSLALSEGVPGVVGPSSGSGPALMRVYTPLATGGANPLVLGLLLDGGGWTMRVAGRLALPVGLLCLSLILALGLLASVDPGPARARPVTWRLLPPVMSIVLLLVLGFGLLLRFREQQDSREDAQNHVNELLGDFEKDVAMQGAYLKAVLGGAIKAEGGRLAPMLARGDSQGLLSSQQALFRHLREDSGVTRLYFIAADGTCLLRMHNPRFRGDRIQRFTWQEARRARQAVAGLELGPSGALVLRAVQPVFRQGAVAGYVEIGQEIEELVQGLRLNHNSELALLVRKDRLDRAAWEEDMRLAGRNPDWEAFGAEVLVMSTMGALPQEIGAVLRENEGAALTLQKAAALGRNWMLSSFSLSDAAGRKDARILVLQDATRDTAEFRRLSMLAGVGLGSLLAFLFVLVFVLLRRTDQGILAREEALRKSEDTARKLSRAVEQSPASVIITDLDGFIEYVNPKFSETTGYTFEEVQGRNPRMLKSGDMPPESYREMWQTITSGQEWRGEFKNRRKDGRVYWEFASLSPIRDASGKTTHYLAVKEDITERKKAEDAVQELAQRLHKIASRVPGVVFQYLLRPDGSSCFPYASEGIRDIYRVEPEDVRESAAPAAARVHPRDRRRLDASILRSAGDLKPWRQDYRVRFPDGEERWLSGNAVPQREPDGSTLWHGFISDITERRNAQEALRQSEQALRSLYEHAPAGIFRSTLDGRYLAVNPYYARIYGYDTPAEMIEDVRSIPRQMYRNPMDREWLLSQLEQTGEVRNFEVERNTRHGALRWVSLSIRAVRDEAGKILHLDGFCSDITEQKQAQQALAESESRFRALFENSPVAYQSLDESGRIIGLNEELCSLLGYDREELLGRRFDECWAPDSRDGFSTVFGHMLDAGHCTSELRLLRKDGRAIVVLLEGRVQRGPAGDFVRTHCVLYNITERTEMEAALREATERQQRIADTVPLALYDYVQREDGTGVYQYLSPRFSEIFEVEPAAVLGDEQGLLPFLHPEDRDRLLAVDRLATITGGLFNVEVRALTPAGRVKWVHLMSRPRPLEGGRGTVWSGFMLDITLRKQMEERVREATLQLEATTARAEALAADAEAASRAKGEFLANMSHEIRTPMNAVIGMTHLALQTELTPKQRDFLGKIDRAARSLLGILNDILDLSKVEAGMLTVESVDFDLDLVLEDLAGMLAVKAHEKGLELLLDIDPAAPRRLRGDPLRLGQVLVNLAGNAVKFTEQGEVRIRVQALDLSRPGQVRLGFGVSDSGIGMTPEQLERLFQPFTQADASTSRRFGGTGLGLSISRRLVELLGGEISVVSAPGQGSEFRFELALPLAAEQGRGPSPESLAGRRVLVVDDSRSAREIMAVALRRLGLAPELAASGPEALDMLVRAGASKPFDLVLLDWKMPGMDGMEVARRIHQEERLTLRPAVVMLTAHDRDSLARLPESGLAEALLMKPVGPSLLLNTLLEIFGSRAVTPAGTSRAQDEAARRALDGTRVLLVEDNEINRQVGEGILEHAGVQVTLAEDGETALALLAVETFDAVLMDIQMPGMDGFETTRRIRESESLRRLPIIAMTAHALATDRERTRAAGMNGHVVKPIDPGALFAELMRHVPRPAATAAPGDAAGPARANDLPARLPGLDAAGALERLGGDADLYRELLRQFSDQYAGYPADIRQALQTGDRNGARALAHSLRGVAGNLGALDVERAAGNLEQALLAEAGSAGLAPLAEALETALAALLATLTDLERTPGPAAPKD